MEFAEIIAALGVNKAIVTFFISMLPIVELRLAIPVGVSMGLPVWEAALISIAGNIVPVPFILAFIRTVIEWLRGRTSWMRRFAEFLERKADGPNADRVRRYEFLGLLVLVAIPLPGTGAWTGALIAALLRIRIKRALPPIFLGVILAAIIVSLATAGVIHLVL